MMDAEDVIGKLDEEQRRHIRKTYLDIYQQNQVEIKRQAVEIARLRAALNEIRTLPGTAAEVGTLAPTIAENGLKGGAA